MTFLLTNLVTVIHEVFFHFHISRFKIEQTYSLLLLIILLFLGWVSYTLNFTAQFILLPFSDSSFWPAFSGFPKFLLSSAAPKGYPSLGFLCLCRLVFRGKSMLSPIKVTGDTSKTHTSCPDVNCIKADSPKMVLQEPCIWRHIPWSFPSFDVGLLHLSYFSVYFALYTGSSVASVIFPDVRSALYIQKSIPGLYHSGPLQALSAPLHISSSRVLWKWEHYYSCQAHRHNLVQTALCKLVFERDSLFGKNLASARIKTDPSVWLRASWHPEGVIQYDTLSVVGRGMVHF